MTNRNNHGLPIIAARTFGGHRDYLDDKPINAGDGIDLLDDGLWVPGRYEAAFDAGTAFFYYTDDAGIERWLRIDRDTMRFRWPSHTM